MYLNLHRFFSSPKQSNSKTPKTPMSELFSSLRARFSLTRPQKQQQQQQKPKTVHWGNITIIQDIDEDKPKPESKPDPKPEPEPKPYNHNYKPILKQPTPLDKTTSQASLWELINETEARIRLNYEYLGITGDVALDAWFRKEEETMFRRANAVARDNLKRRADASAGSGVPVDVPVKDDGEEWEFVADMGGEKEGRAEKPRRVLKKCLQVSVLRA